MKASDAIPQETFYVVGGTVRRDATCYRPRQADTDLYDALSSGQFCYVLTARQMGKSSLMVRTAARLRLEGVGVGVVDLSAIGQHNLSVEQWYVSLLSQVGLGLALEDELLDYWREAHPELSPLQRWMRAIRDLVLTRSLGRVAIFIDEIDAVRSLPFSTDEFFAAIRESYNRRAEDPEYERLTFCLLGVATPSDLIRDPRTTPFNIGRRIELHDFTETEASQLAQGLGRGSELNAALLKRVFYWTAGHPYLTQLLCHAVAGNMSVNDKRAVDRLCRELLLTRRAREQDDNILFVRERMLRTEPDLAGLLTLYANVHLRRRVVDDDTNPLVTTLRLAGIVRSVNGALAVRNRIYEYVFDQEWVRTNMPDAEIRRQSAAYRRGMWRATAVAAIVLAVITVLALATYRQRNLATQREQAYRRLLYTAQISLAQQAYEANDIGRVNDLLEAYLPRAGQEDLRGFEWFYLNRISHKAHELRGHAQDIYSVAISPDGRTLASGGQDKVVKLWDLVGRRELKTFDEKGIVHSLAFSPDGKSLASGTSEVLSLWDVASKQKLPAVAGQSRGVRSVAFSSDGKLLATGMEDGTVVLWDLTRLGMKKTLRGHSNLVSSVMFSPDCRSLVTASHDHSAKIWDVAAGRELATLLGHTDRLCCAVFSPEGNRLTTGGADNALRVWDVATRQLLASVNKSAGAIQSILYFPDGKTLAIGGSEGVLSLWDVATEQEIVALKGHAGNIWSGALSADGKTLATVGSDHIVRLWDTDAEREERSFLAARGGLKPFILSPDCRIVVMRSGDQKTFRLRDFVTRTDLGVFTLPMSASISAAISPQGKTLAVSTVDKRVRLWDVAGKRELPGIDGQGASTTTLTFSPEGRRLAMGGFDRTVKVWDLNIRRNLATLEARSGPINSLAFSSSGEILAIGSPGAVQLWDLTSARELASFPGNWAVTWGLAFSPDGKRLAAALSDWRVKLWDVPGKLEVTAFEANAAAVMSVAFSPDGRRLVTGGADNSVRLWDVASGQPLLTFREHASAVTQVAFSGDGASLGSLSLGGTARFWVTK